jgi:tRNA modification GTPase
MDDPLVPSACPAPLATASGRGSEDTIVAIATPPGRGGLGVVRLSGPRALEIAGSVIHASHWPPQTQRATLGFFHDPASGRLLDEVIVVAFRAPHSYTAEDLVELSCHGAPVLLAYLVECCLKQGARPAEPGEFTLRAFLNGRMDLTQAEAVRDLIESRTLYQARVAAQQLQGSLSALLTPHKQALLELIARLEAGIDFAEDDVPVSDWEEITRGLDSIRAPLERLAAGYEYGRIVREGLSLAIIGRPNVGKSSLFNRLLNEERAIVTATPGTTRDLITESASLDGIPLRLVDTAGIRHTQDEAEAIGVRKTFQAIADSDLRLLVVDASEGWTPGDAELLERLLPLGALLIACNKCDLPRRITPELMVQVTAPEAVLGAEGGGPDVAATPRTPGVVWTSALTGEGLPELKRKVREVAAPAVCLGEGGLLTNLRHHQLIQDSLAALGRARTAAEKRVHHEMLLLDLYDALHALDNITGATTTEDILGVIFSTFCVGK